MKKKDQITPYAVVRAAALGSSSSTKPARLNTDAITHLQGYVTPLEAAVINAAIDWRLRNTVNTQTALTSAVDNLIAAKVKR